MTDEAKLAACPFCGGEAQPAIIHGGGIEWAQVECVNQSCGAVGPTPATEAEAIAAWNRREAAVDSGMSGEAVANAEQIWANLPTGREWTSLATYEKALVCHTLAALRRAPADEGVVETLSRLCNEHGDIQIGLAGEGLAWKPGGDFDPFSPWTHFAALSHPASAPEGVVQAMRELLRGAYYQGALDVHNEWIKLDLDNGLSDDPDFGEAAYDYAHSIDLRAALAALSTPPAEQPADDAIEALIHGSMHKDFERRETIDSFEVGRRFMPCPTCGQSSHSVGDDELAEAFMHFEAMYDHRSDGIPTQHWFDERTREMAQRLVAAAKRPTDDAMLRANEAVDYPDEAYVAGVRDLATQVRESKTANWKAVAGVLDDCASLIERCARAALNPERKDTPQ